MHFLLGDNFNLMRKIVEKLFGWKIRENIAVLHFLQLLTTLISREKLSQIMEMLRFSQN